MNIIRCVLLSNFLKGCIDGRYGNDCSKNCSQFCRNQTCEQNTGICAYGCLKGYTGGECNQR